MNLKKSKRLVFLDYMRVFAFMSVLIGHKLMEPLQAFISNSNHHSTLRLIAELIYPICLGGAAGVVVFFLTSGYIITHVLQTESTLDFIIKRIFRIYPLYMVAVILEWFMWNKLNGQQFPSLSVLIPQLLLIGDFFQTPHALAGVEWTLRIEIIFYAYMAFLKWVGAFRYQYILPWVMLASACTLFFLPEIPGKDIWVHGYFTLYAPFLFMGALVYLIEFKKANRYVCVVVMAIIFVYYLFLLSKLHPAWSRSHFAVLALGIFIASWIFRFQLPDGAFLRGASDLTYSVYLFHNWLWLYLMGLVKDNSFVYISDNFQVFVILIIICYLMQKTVEVGGVKLGKKVLLLIRSRSISHPISIKV